MHHIKIKAKITLLIAITFFSVFNGFCQNRISINIPSSDEEATYIRSTIQDIKFFEEHNYQISLPKGQFIELLKTKAKADQLSEKDYEDLKAFMLDSVYNKSDYEQGYRKIKNQITLINNMIAKMGALDLNWEFKSFDEYQINLTLYGPGGSYNPEEGSLLIYTTPEGKFKQYDNPANTIIHEITHIGIETSIINKYNVPHQLKERIVDTIVSLNFKELLPDYSIQDMGDTRIDSYLKTKSDLKDLKKFVEQIMTDN